jgi:hypothetical protein
MLPHAGLEIRCTFQPDLAQAPKNQELTRARLGTGSEICLGFASELVQRSLRVGMAGAEMDGEKLTFHQGNVLTRR